MVGVMVLLDAYRGKGNCWRNNQDYHTQTKLRSDLEFLGLCTVDYKNQKPVWVLGLAKLQYAGMTSLFCSQFVLDKYGTFLLQLSLLPCTCSTHRLPNSPTVHSLPPSKNTLAK